MFGLKIYLFLFQATDEDLGDELTYQIVPDSMSATDSSLESLVSRNPFKVTANSLRLNIDVQDTSLRGMFTFTVQVSDKGWFVFTILVTYKKYFAVKVIYCVLC